MSAHAPGLAAQEAAPATADAYVFENVTVIPMDGERSLPGQSVVVRDGRITALGPAASVEAPADAVVIDGAGRYLMPGLADMRVRFPEEDDPMVMLVEDEFLFLHLANGITTVRGSPGAPYQLELREAVARGEVLGPRIHVGTPAPNGDPSASSRSAAERIPDQAEAGYDFVTIHPGLSRQAWADLVEAASRAGLPFAGHVPPEVGVVEALEAGISTLDRLEGYLDATRRDGLPANASLEERFRATDREKLAALARMTADAGVYVVPAQYLSYHLAGWSPLFGWAHGDSIVALPEFQYVSMAQKDTWVTTAWNRMTGTEITPESAEAHAEWRRELLGALHAAGVPILAGTDSPELFNVPAFTLHRELALMVDAGLTPYEALESATGTVARYVAEELGGTADFGRVAPGSRADLLLLDENPIETVEALQARAGVMVGGRWLPEEEIEERLKAIASRYAPFDTD